MRNIIPYAPTLFRWMIVLAFAWIIFFTRSCHAADPWTKTDTTLQAIVIASFGVDLHQSKQLKDCGLEEIGWARNFIGSHPTNKQYDLYFLSAAVVHTLIAIELPKHAEAFGFDVPARTLWQSFWIGVETSTIHQNHYRCGLSIGF